MSIPIFRIFLGALLLPVLAPRLHAQAGGDANHGDGKPPGGLLLDSSLPTLAQNQIVAHGGARGSVGGDGKSLHIDFAGGKDESVTFKPATGIWNLNEKFEVTIKVQNIGQTPMTPSARLESATGPSDVVTARGDLFPGDTMELVVPFGPKVPWKGQVDPRQGDPKAGGVWVNQPGTGTLFHSNATTGVTILSDQSPGAKTLLVTSIKADLPKLVLPDWLGKRPPVKGEWTQTLNEQFDGNAINLHLWNVHCRNFWDPRMHFSKDEVMVNNGLLTLRVEKKTGYNNDDSTGQTPYSGAKSDYAVAQISTYGKWTQRYGYFEVREKQPTAKDMWPGFWMMPDRGLKAGATHESRQDTANGGMEFDVSESQALWGINRCSSTCHWDGYGTSHKYIGPSADYIQADKDGFIVVGLLWTPGSVVVYGNGKEVFRWESPRVSALEEFLILQNEFGGWDNEPLDDAELPSDFQVAYVRAWQRKDLATPEDGAKPNKGDYDAFREPLPDADPAAGATGN
jgi:beta-glucanase (GH16 family)